MAGVAFQAYYLWEAPTPDAPKTVQKRRKRLRIGARRRRMGYKARTKR